MALPLVGSVDWKWFIIGVLFAHFGIGFIMSLVGKARQIASPAKTAS